MKQEIVSIQTAYRRRWVILLLNSLLALTGVAAAGALALEYGFRSPPVRPSLLHGAELAIVAVFLVDRVLRVVLARRRMECLRENWIDFALMGLAGAAVAVSHQFLGRVVSAGALYVAITQGYILIHLVLRGVSVNLRFADSGIHPTWLLIGSFAFLIASGTGLLMLEKATPVGQSISLVDALFTATSATCVTGLVVKDIGADFTGFGQGVILLLIQSGGLGIMLFGTVFALLMGRELTVRSSSTLGQMLSTEQTGQMRRTVTFVIAATFAWEVLGAVLLYPMFASVPQPQGAAPQALSAAWSSVFHSISAFCNAGFSLYASNLYQGVDQAGWSKPLRDHWQMLGVLAPLIVLGGLGFPVLQDCARYAWVWAKRLAARRPGGRPIGQRPRLLLHSKLVLWTSAALIVLGALVLLAVEPPPQPKRVVMSAIGNNQMVKRPITVDPGDWGRMDQAHRAREAVFQSVSARTAGFNTIDLSQLSDGGKLSLCWLMIIGGSPASTAGGMKTVTFALLLLTAYCVIRQRDDLEVFRRTVATDILRKAVTLAVMYVVLVSTVTLLLNAWVKLGPRFTFIDLFFESCSACGTVGLSTGVTPYLNDAGKLVLAFGMFAGRLGPLTLVLALTTRLRHVNYSYPHENVVIG